MTFEEFMVRSHAIIDEFIEFDAEMMLPLICTLIDITAIKNEKTSAELLAELTPVITAVGEELGPMNLQWDGNAYQS